MADSAKKSKKQRKVGRNAEYCKFYAVTKRREKNKLRRVKKHVARFPDDKVALKCIDILKAII
ncbi:MAG TPA: hypothetical protein VEP90_11535 [Methylomirabilota bacterium]|nr:hypothetical protein [Methylomirabilota bacterium]